jgi:hypothetical protein
MAAILRNGGIGSIIFGVIGAGIGLSMMDENPINGILVLIGIGLLLEGIWIVSAPSPGGLIADGIALVILGVWNIFTTLHNATAGGGPGFFGILGGYQIYLGFKSFGRYDRFSALASGKPSTEVLTQVEGMVKAVSTAKPGVPDQVVAFQEGEKQWRGKLFGDIAVFVKGGGEDVLFLDKNDVAAAAPAPIRKGKQYKIQFHLGTRNVDGSIAAEALSTYEQWRSVAV